MHIKKAVIVEIKDLIYQFHCSGADNAINWKCSVLYMLCEECAELYIMLSSNILFSSISSRVSEAVPSTELGYFTNLFSFFESLALMLLPKQMAAKKIALSITDLWKIFIIYLTHTAGARLSKKVQPALL